MERFQLAEYPVELKPLARELAHEKILPDADGFIHVPEAPGLGITPDLPALQKYLVPVRIEVGGRTLYETPPLA